MREDLSIIDVLRGTRKRGKMVIKMYHWDPLYVYFCWCDKTKGRVIIGPPRVAKEDLVCWPEQLDCRELVIFCDVSQ